MNINLTLVAQAVAFALFIWFTARFVWPPLLRAIETRQAQIADGLAAAERGKQDLELASKRAEDVVREARQRAQDILGQADKRAAELVEEAKSQAKTEGDRIIAGAKAEIDQEVFRAKEGLRAQVAVLAVQGAEKILRREVDAKAHADLLNAVAAELWLAQIMAELTTIARPYAQAVFSLARDQSRFAPWSDMLGFIAGVYADDQVQQALANPKLTKEDVERLLIAICGDRLDAAGRNLLILLVRNDRLMVLPHIVQRYELLREEQEDTVEASVESAFPLTDEQLSVLLERLEKRTGHKVKANVNVAPELIGGVKVQIGDEVWDASVRGQIDGMAGALMR